MSTNSKIRWTPAELKKLRDIYSEKPDSELVVIFSRSISAIEQKARRVGMTIRPGVGRGHGIKTKCSHLPVGSERLGISGTPERKISLAGSKHENWKRMDEIEWEAVYGLIPDGMVLFKLPGKPRTVENLRLVHRSAVPMFAARNALTPELRKLIDLKCRISFALNRIEELNPDVPREAK